MITAARPSQAICQYMAEKNTWESKIKYQNKSSIRCERIIIEATLLSLLKLDGCSVRLSRLFPCGKKHKNNVEAKVKHICSNITSLTRNRPLPARLLMIPKSRHLIQLNQLTLYNLQCHFHLKFQGKLYQGNTFLFLLQIDTFHQIDVL